MFHKKLKQMGAWLLAFSLVLGSVQLPAMEAKASDTNLALSATATASSIEASSLPAAQANDGSDSTRWASDVSDDAQTLQLSWDSVQTMKSFVVKWERRNATEYAIETSSDGSNWTPAASFSEKPAKTVQEITLDNPVQAQYVRLNIKAHSADGAEGETSWNNVSVWEFEVYEGDIPDNRTEMEKLIDSIEAPQISADGTHISMPELPEGVTVRFCADYEQVIGEDGTIYAPVEDKVVKGVYEITKGEDEAQTEEFTFTVPGKYKAEENANEKPSVIPELQEWYGGQGQFAVSETSKIVADEALADTAARFAENYEEITGSEIQVVTGDITDASTGDFYLTLDTSDKGLGKEGYLLKIGNIAVVEASEATGAYWGVISILQILKQTNGVIAKGIARDYPKYEVRGFSLDVGRKPFDLETVYDFAKNMSWYKMNSFQVHLSDNLIFHEDYSSLKEAQENSYAGFRLESSLKPEEGSMVDTLHSQDIYYTKDEMRSLVRESREQGVNIVPEFDMPAHALPITRAFPSLQSTTAGGHGWLIEELDLTQIDAATQLAEDIWNEYFTDYDGNGSVFDEETTVHIGTDEFHGGNNEETKVEDQQGRELFRQFSANMINFIQGTGRTVRMWGSLTNKTGTTEVPSEDVQLNIWNTDYANPQDMYDLGYDLINTLEGSNYIVPAAGYYNDYINAQSIYNTWKPNVIGNLNASAGDDQILGGCYAIWHDSVDTRANGISQYDSFDRFFQALPAYSAKLWGEAQDRNYSELTAVFDKTGTAPGTSVYGEVKSSTETVLNYTFDDTLTKDSSANGYDAADSKNVSQGNSDSSKALKLNGGESYLTTASEINKIGSDTTLSMRVKMDEDADGEQILCESKDEFGTYGTYAIKASQKNTGKVGFSREGYDYSFDYTLPKGEWVELTFRGGKDTVALYVDGELVDDNPEIRYANHETTELSANLTAKGITKICTMMIPVGRIGSTTKSFKGLIDDVTVSTSKAITGNYSDAAIAQSELTASGCSTHAAEGSYAAMLDGDANTYWHTNYSSNTEYGSGKDHNHYITLTFNGDAKTINMLSYLPRQNSTNGRIYKYSIDVTKADGTVMTDYASGTWAADMTEKFAVFEPIEAKSVKLNILTSEANHGTAAEMNLYNVSVNKSDLTEALNAYKNLDSSEYTAQSWNAFQEAFASVEAIANNENSTINDNFIAYGQLQSLSSMLVEKPEPTTVDVSALQAKIEELEALDMSLYTEESAELIKKQIETARKVLANPIAAAEVSEMAAVLDNAQKEVLVKKPLAVDSISSALADAEKLLANTSGYTAASVAALQKAVADAKAVLANPDATQAQIDAALKALQEAKLVKADVAVQEPNPNNPGNPAVQAVPKAGTVTTVKDVQYKVTKSDAKNGTVAVVKMAKKTAKKIVIPSSVTIDGYTFKVTAINAKVFQKAKKLTTVTVGANVKKIGAKAFYKCTKLKKVIFKGVKAPAIGKQAFKGTAAKCKVTTPKKMVKKQRNLLKTRLKKAGLGKKATVK